MKKVATRFAPSPTGPLHIGGVRTALFNWLYSKNQKGDFYLRIEDTDKERSKEEHKIQIIKSLKWIGIEHDGEEYIQSTIEFGMKNDFVSTILGRKRNTVNLKSSNKNIVEAEKRATINMPIQGSASDLIKVAMIKIYNEFKRKSFKSKIVLLK